MRLFTGIVLVSMVAGCATQATEVGPLGIADREIVERENGVEISAFDTTGKLVGTAVLTTGNFVMQDDGRAVFGRQLAIKVGTSVVNHESEGLNPLELPAIGAVHGAAELNAFMSDPVIGSTLRGYGIGVDVAGTGPISRATVAPPTELREASYTSNCAFTPPCGGAGASSCAQMYGCPIWPGDEVQVVCCNAPTSTVAIRYCGSGWGCGVPGSGGCAPCWSAPYYSSCSAWVSGGFTCDWDFGSYGYPAAHYSYN